ncbi:HNH endonuclease [Vibrio diabolicus]|uniref:HNH endonuclease n=1 Tax=Vibrio diabolicus TaxID=50719 RepID=UPI0015F55378|nr:HNH endonuclease [Vibrio diabolicus]
MKREVIDIGEVVEYWRDKPNSFGALIDINEPTCWSCGQPWEGRHDVLRGSYLRGWRKAPLQICHVIPKSLGGDEHPSNLVLMCKECHDLAPNTSFPEIMYKWMAKQSYFKRLMAKLELALSDFEIKDDEFQKLTDISQTPEFKNWARKHCGLHWPQSGYSGLGTKMTLSTYVGLMKHYSSRNAL